MDLSRDDVAAAAVAVGIRLHQATALFQLLLRSFAADRVNWHTQVFVYTRVFKYW